MGRYDSVERVGQGWDGRVGRCAAHVARETVYGMRVGPSAITTVLRHSESAEQLPSLRVRKEAIGIWTAIGKTVWVIMRGGLGFIEVGSVTRTTG